MNVSRLAILGVALVAGVAAFFLMMGRSPQETIVQVAQPVDTKTVQVLVANRNIQRGERLSAKDTKWQKWPKNAVKQHFLTDDTPGKREEMENAVARSVIVEGEPIVEEKVVHAGDSGLMAAIITPGYRAVTLRVTPETSAGGFILPGDRVDVLHTVGRNDTAATRMIFENIRVLAVNTVYTEVAETPNIDGVNVTLELTPKDAESFITSRASGALSLVLRSIFKPEGEVQAKTNRSSDVNIIRYGRS